jgi:hypothetical protein
MAGVELVVLRVAALDLLHRQPSALFGHAKTRGLVAVNRTSAGRRA